MPSTTAQLMQGPQNETNISHPDITRWLDIGNALYTTSLRTLSVLPRASAKVFVAARLGDLSHVAAGFEAAGA